MRPSHRSPQADGPPPGRLGPPPALAGDPASPLHAPLRRHGYLARNRHKEITYDASLLDDDLERRLCLVAGQLAHWFQANGLALNPKKTQVMLFNLAGRRSRPLQVKVGSEDLFQVDTSCFLGFKVDCGLSWSDHIDWLCGRLGGACFALQRLAGTVPREVARSCYFATIQSLLTYGIELWGRAADWHRAFVMQKRAVRAMARIKSDESARQYFVSLEILTCPSLYILSVALFVRKNLHLYKECRGARRRGQLLDVQHRLARSEQSVYVCGPGIYNKLPTDIKKYEDYKSLSALPPWLSTQTLPRSQSVRDRGALCERETRWTESFLETLHEDLKKARLGATLASAGPLHVLKPRHVAAAWRPSTPAVGIVAEDEEARFQAALTMQTVVRGRAVHNLMFEGRMRAFELTEELKSTHALQPEDRERITREHARATDYEEQRTAKEEKSTHALQPEDRERITREHARATDYEEQRTAKEEKESAISALVQELCGGAVSAALDLLEKELRRLQQERRLHASVMIALREKSMREAAEAGRRQKEEQRRREHDEMFKHVLGVTQETVDAYLQEIVSEGVERGAEEAAATRARAEADRVDALLRERPSLSTAEENELVAELVHQFLLPAAHKEAARQRVQLMQGGRLGLARKAVVEACEAARADETAEDVCLQPTETIHRHDPRWKHTRRHKEKPQLTHEDRFPPQHDMRCMLNDLLQDVVVQSRTHKEEIRQVSREHKMALQEKLEVEIEARGLVDAMLDRATGLTQPPVKESDYHYLMKRQVPDAMARTEPPRREPVINHYYLMKRQVPDAMARTEAPRKEPCSRLLPSELRLQRAAAADRAQPWCKCEPPTGRKEHRSVRISEMHVDANKPSLLPSEQRYLDDMKKCKCDQTEENPARGDYYRESRDSSLLDVNPTNIINAKVLSSAHSWHPEVGGALEPPPTPASRLSLAERAVSTDDTAADEPERDEKGDGDDDGGDEKSE
ncbi:unnamed protein product [Plutella xylostella]|uniref:(diamondback moth) hypothetical protein n=1 Tax=Plutella xylostella TaxID=51655 RepID=A0A8S4G6G5_PLUXY|nr:unnamed protein product [Plutella xylostella]